MQTVRLAPQGHGQSGQCRVGGQQPKCLDFTLRKQQPVEWITVRRLHPLDRGGMPHRNVERAKPGGLDGICRASIKVTTRDNQDDKIRVGRNPGLLVRNRPPEGDWGPV